MESVRRSLHPNPRDKANILSVLVFWWTLPIFRNGYRKVLELSDLYAPREVDHSQKLGDRLEKQWFNEVSKPKGNPSLIIAVVKTFWREYTILGLICLFNEVFVRLSQPFLLGRLLAYFRQGSTMSHQEALGYAGGIVAFNALSALVINQYYMSGFYNGMKVRIAVCSIIYRKSLRLSQTALGETAVGKVVNLLSNDVNRFDLVSFLINFMWTAPIMALVVGYLLYIEVGWAGIIGIAIVFIVVPIQSYTGKLSSIFRLQTALRTDERVRFMDEIISGVQVIKMYAWEWPFSKLIAMARKTELKIVLKSSFVRGLYMTFLMFTTRMALFCTMLSIVLLYGSEQLTAARVFVISAYFNIVSYTMSQMFVRGVAEIAEGLVAFRRLQNFLEYEEKDTISGPLNNSCLTSQVQEQKHVSQLASDEALIVENATARWIPLSKLEEQITEHKQTLNGTSSSVETTGKEQQRTTENSVWKQATLHEVSVRVKRGTLVGVVGPVGSGKTSFLQTILRELPLESGSIAACGSVSYASQEPWVFGGSARQNILFGQDMDRKRYDDVVKTCSLIKDFEQFEKGDLTIIGERGTSLSGGQKARINLARAVYRYADLYLLDDPLSAVDAHVGHHIFNECIGPKGILARRNSTRILVTHQVHFLKDADWVIILKEGKIEIQGHPAQLAKSGVDFATLLFSDDSNDEKGDSQSMDGRRGSRVSLKSSKSIENHDLDQLSDDDTAKSVEQLQQLESSSKGKVKGSVGLVYLISGTNCCTLILLLVLFLLTQALASGADYWVSYWTAQEELRHYNSTYRQLHLQDTTNNTKPIITDSRQDGRDDILSTDWCIYIHAGLVASLFTVALFRSLGFYSVCIRASQSLHDNMFKGLISTSMRFFDTNPSGRILNRFSKDMGSADEFLPKAILDASQIILNMTGVIIVTSIVNPIFLAPIAVLALIFGFVRIVFLRTSNNLKRLDGSTRSPVFIHLSATLNGLSTIRAFGAQSILVEEFDNHQDLHTACWYLYVVTSSAFGFSLDVLTLILVTFIVFYFLTFGEDALGDKVGLAITQTMSLTGLLQWGIRQSAEVSNQLMSVERILEYRDLEPERIPPKPKQLDKTWPQEGRIEFKSVVYRYFAGAEPVLKGLSFVVQPKEKIGIVGRTGAGKSSLISAIFRLAVIEGEIIVDGINTDSITLTELRSKISIIPQDPVLFSGTLRRNLDPFEEYADEKIWQALADVELKDIASGPLGLQSSVMSSGSNFSVGQRQLICLARAILRNNRILVLDEATANVDPKTDSLIQQTIRYKFAECTVLTVAHRLHTIMDSDRVLVMDTGVAAQFASPHELLQQRRGIFYEMVRILGPHEMERMSIVAREKFESSRKVS